MAKSLRTRASKLNISKYKKIKYRIDDPLPSNSVQYLIDKCSAFLIEHNKTAQEVSYWAYKGIEKHRDISFVELFFVEEKSEQELLDEVIAKELEIKNKELQELAKLKEKYD